MKIYLTHSTNFNFDKDLYEPLRKSSLFTEHTVILPHEKANFTHSRESIESSSVVIAEVSHPSIGEGIELGWANKSNIPIICVYKEGKKISPALRTVSNVFLQYKTVEDMIDKVTTALTAIRNGL